MKAFYALVFICLVVMIALIISFGLTIKDYLVIIKNLLFDIKGLFYQFRDDRYDTRNFAKEIRDNTSAIHDLLDKEPEEGKPVENDTGDSKDGWTLAPCPVCGTPARMAYDHDTNGGFYVICSKHSRNDGCDYGIVTGGSTRRIAARMWNETAVQYTRRMLHSEKEAQDANTDSN